MIRHVIRNQAKLPSSDSIYYILGVPGCINIPQVILSGKGESLLP